MGVAKSDFCQMRRIDLGLIKNTERFARIDLDLKKNATITVGKWENSNQENFTNHWLQLRHTLPN